MKKRQFVSFSFFFVALVNCKPAEELDIPQTTTTTTTTTTAPITTTELDINSGKWLPDSEKDECGRRLFLSHIVGGRIAKLGDYPYMALIGYDTDGKQSKTSIFQSFQFSIQFQLQEMVL